MRKLLLVVLMLGVWATLLAEEFTDGGLEAWTSGTNLTNWTEDVGGTSTVNQDSADKRSGSYCARSEIDTLGNYAAIYQEVTLDANTEYEMSYYQKSTDAAACEPYLYIRCRKAGDFYNFYLQADTTTWGAGSSLFIATLSAAYQQQVYTFTTTDSSGLYRFYIERTGGCNGDTLYYDDLSVTETVSGGSSRLIIIKQVVL